MFNHLPLAKSPANVCRPVIWDASGNMLTADDHNKEHFLPPAVFLNADANGQLIQDEIFGLVMPLAPVENLESAIGAANRVRFG